LGNAVPHGARAEHSYGMNWASHSRVIVFVRAFAQSTLNKGAEPKKWGSCFSQKYGWGLPGSTNSYSPSYTIRATENANTFSVI
ncbi:MAG: hypothetical protein QOE96_2474, partial [Blastocatellia bacterium]|nr:hypothetical protein [Blastocatellia bacterium]